MTKNDSPCDRAEQVRDYAFDELPRSERPALERHLKECAGCAAELDRLQLTTAALRVLPDAEMPRRIAFVSDKVFEPNWFTRFWNSAAQLGFASACVLAAGISFAAMHGIAGIPAVIQTASGQQASAQQASAKQPASVSDRQAIDEALAKAVSAAVEKTRSEDMQLTKAALEQVDRKYEQQQQNMMVSMQENLRIMQKHLGTATLLSANYEGAER